MISPTAWLFILVLFFALWSLSALTLFAHYQSERFGLLPMIFLLGALTGMMQFRSLGFFHLQILGDLYVISVGSFVLLPTLLLGLLIVYIVNGTTQARNCLLAMVFVTGLVSVIQVTPGVILTSGTPLYLRQESAPSAGAQAASALTLTADLVILIVAYQAVCNLRGRYPSRLAAALALVFALVTDALLYPVLTQFAGPLDSAQMFIHVPGKMLAGLALFPGVYYYLEHHAVRMQQSAAASMRPTFDLFTTTQQLEARARYHSSLLRTLRRIDQVILRTDESDQLLIEACRQLVTTRNHPLAWIGLVKEGSPVIQPAARAGRALAYLDEIRVQADDTPLGRGPTGTAFRTRKTVLIYDTRRDPRFAPWKENALRYGLLSAAAFPMRHADRIWGVLTVYNDQPQAFDDEEAGLLQELADNLAYALHNLETRRRQAILQTGAENMLDGLLITDLKGKVLYANAAVGEFLAGANADLNGQNLLDLIPSEDLRKRINPFVETLFSQNYSTGEFELPDHAGNVFTISARATLLAEPPIGPAYVVLSLRDISDRQLYERQFLTLNRLTSDLAQLHNPQSFLETILQTCEQILGADASGIVFMDAAQKKTPAVFGRGLPEGLLQCLHSAMPIERAGNSTLNYQTVFISDQDRGGNPDFPISILKEANFHAALILPLEYGEQQLGILALFYARTGTFSPQIQQLGQTISQTLAIALQNTRLYQAELDQRRLAEALSRASYALNRTLDLDEVLDQILEQTARVVPCELVNIMLIIGANAQVVRYLNLRTGTETRRSQTGLRLPLDTPILKHMLTTGEPVLVPDTLKDPRWMNLDLTAWMRSYAGAPLRLRQETIGFLNIHSNEPDYFSAETVSRLQAFAATAASAIQNARFYQDLQRHNQELENRVRARTAELSAAKERIERILVSVPDAVFVLDARRHPVQANLAGEALMTQALKADFNLFEPDFIDRLHRQPEPTDQAIVEIDGRAYQALASPLLAADTQSGHVVVFRDVTRFQELDKMKNQFVSDVSHELRTPLTNLTIYLDLLSSSSDTEKKIAYTDTLRRETQRLTHLIDDLLTISRLEAGRVPIELHPTDINQLVAHLVRDRSAMAAAKELRLEYQTRPNLPQAYADERLLTQVLSNLLTNALNYTLPQGSIRVATNQRRQGTKVWISIAIIDSGVGIPGEELPHVFERFYRGSASQKTGAPGTGLGLSISKEIVVRMGGQINVRSTPGKGTIFTVWLKAVL